MYFLPCDTRMNEDVPAVFSGAPMCVEASLRWWSCVFFSTPGRVTQTAVRGVTGRMPALFEPGEWRTLSPVEPIADQVEQRQASLRSDAGEKLGGENKVGKPCVSLMFVISGQWRYLVVLQQRRPFLFLTKLLQRSRRDRLCGWKHLLPQRRRETGEDQKLRNTFPLPLDQCFQCLDDQTPWCCKTAGSGFLFPFSHLHDLSPSIRMTLQGLNIHLLQNELCCFSFKYYYLLNLEVKALFNIRSEMQT